MSGTRTEPTAPNSTDLDTTTADAVALDRSTQHQREQPSTDAPRERVVSRRDQAMADILARANEQRAARDLIDQQIIDTSMSPEDRELAAQERAEAQQALTEINRSENARADETIARRQAANPTNTQKEITQRNIAVPGSVQVEGQEPRFPVPVNGKTVYLTNTEIAALVNVGAQTVDAQQRAQTQPAAQPVRQQAAAPTQTQQTQTGFGLPANWRPPTINDESADRLLKQISYATDAEARLAIKDIIATAVMISAIEWNKALPGLIAHVKEQTKAEMRAEVEYSQMLATLANEFSDVFQSEAKSKTAGLLLLEIRERNAKFGTQMSELDASREALLRVRAEYNMPGNQSVAVNNTQPNTNTNTTNAQASRVAISPNRVDRKRAAPQVPQTAGKGNVAENVSGPITRSDIVNKMRAARGQAVIN